MPMREVADDTHIPHQTLGDALLAISGLRDLPPGDQRRTERDAHSRASGGVR